MNPPLPLFGETLSFLEFLKVGIYLSFRYPGLLDLLILNKIASHDPGPVNSLRHHRAGGAGG